MDIEGRGVVDIRVGGVVDIKGRSVVYIYRNRKDSLPTSANGS